MTRHVVVGTAGHIDHGKTSLVKALTGIDTDRLPEEKARGITIDLGFAFLEEPGGLTIEIVDVPGHERFVKNMLAGVGGIDLAMLVIAADEGVMPQTREHLAICSLLRIRGGLVALTKTDLVEPDWLELVRDDVATLVRATFLQGAPIVPVSAKTGAGLPELRQALRRLAESVPERAVDQLARLPIDRVFTVKGFGTVVTGTLAAGRLAVDDRVEVYPKGVEAKVRGLQTHGHPVPEARAGQRTAVNLQGVERAALERGDVLAHAGTLVPAVLVDGTLELLPDAPRGLKTRTRVRFHAGTSEIMARVLLLDRAELAPGETAFARFRLEATLVALPSDRFVVRSYSPIVTIGGGTLLDVDPPRFKRKAPALVAHLTLLQTGGPEVVLEEHVRHVGAAGGSGDGGRREERARQGAARGARGAAHARAAARRGSDRAGVPPGGGGTAEPGRGARARGPPRGRGTRALPGARPVGKAPPRQGVALLPRSGARRDPAEARRHAPGAQGDRSGGYQGPPWHLPEVRDPAPRVLRSAPRDDPRGRTAGLARGVGAR